MVRKGNTVQVGNWTVTCNLTGEGKAAVNVTNKTEKVSLSYDAGKKEGVTVITDQVKGKQVDKPDGLFTGLRDLIPYFCVSVP